MTNMKTKILLNTFAFCGAIMAFFSTGEFANAQAKKPATAEATAGKPNILVIWGDDIGIHNISAYNLGIMGYHTPNIDRIAREGALFTDAYANKAARQAALPSSWGSIHSVPVC